MSSTIPAGVDLSADQRPKILAVAISTWTLSVLAVALRYIARYLSGIGLWANDLGDLTRDKVSAGVLSILPCAYDIHHGFGMHVWVAPPGSVSLFLKSLVVAEIFYCITSVAIKLSILLSYRRIFPVDYMKKATTAVALMVFAWALACIFIVCLQCIPLRGYWDKSVPAKCGVNETKYFLGKSIPDTITDSFIMVIPLHSVWKLHIAPMQKVILTLTFLLGGLATITSIIRLVCLLRINLNSEDITWNFVPYMIWTVVELNVSTITACLPYLRPIHTFLKGKLGLEVASSNASRRQRFHFWPRRSWSTKFSRSSQFSSEQDGYGDQVHMQAMNSHQQDFQERSVSPMSAVSDCEHV